MREWNALSNFAHNLGVKEEIIEKTKQDFNEFLKRYYKTREFVWENHKSKWNESLSIQNFLFWEANLYCFFVLYLSGFRQATLRELRFYLEASARSYYINSKYQKTTYKCKLLIQREVRKKFRELLKGIPKKTELKSFYNKLCEYVHPSEEVQTDALRDFQLNLALQLPNYEEDKEMLKKTFKYCRYLLLESLEEKEATTF
jgi:hypothetical protein